MQWRNRIVKKSKVGYVKYFLQKPTKMFKNFEIANISRACQCKQSVGGVDNNIARYVNTPVL
jgi:hypothetical protein